jgi:tagaturonate reductase
MMKLSKKSLEHIHGAGNQIHAEGIFRLPEKILQFGTGVLLRALPDYFVDKANRQGIFNGRILMVKSTSADGVDAFREQDGLYTLSIRGREEGKIIDEPHICSAVSRVLLAGSQWPDILAVAASRDLQIIISNSTEVGLQLLKESIFQNPPVSFPAKLLAFLYERFKKLNAAMGSGLVIIPTELLTDNGKRLKSILMELADFNKLESSFIKWMDQENQFCSSLVDRIVPGKPDPDTCEKLEKRWEYRDKLMIVCEPYRLWAIEGDDHTKNILSFSVADEGVIITSDITKYRELKLRMLNATHTLSCGLAYLSGFKTVRSSMEDGIFETFIKRLMFDEIGSSIPYTMEEQEIRAFGNKVLDRFRNPYLDHQWLSITMQYSSKLAMRVLPLLYQYYKTHHKPPELISMGFAAYVLFMRPVKKESDKFYGILDNQYYLINDNRASEFFGLWDERSVDNIVERVLSNADLWGSDLTQLEGFSDSVIRKLKGFIRQGTLQEIAASPKTDY